MGRSWIVLLRYVAVLIECTKTYLLRYLAVIMDCPKKETTETKQPTPENAPTEEGSKYPRGVPLFLNLLSIILATIVCGYVCGACQTMLLNFVLAKIETGC